MKAEKVNTGRELHTDLHIGTKRGKQVSPFPSKSVEIVTKILAEVPLQQALERLAVSRFVASHFMHGVMDGVEAQFLGLLGNLHLAGGSAVLGLNAHLQVLLGAVGDDLAQQLSKLGGVLGLFISGLLPVQGCTSASFHIAHLNKSCTENYTFFGRQQHGKTK